MENKIIATRYRLDNEAEKSYEEITVKEALGEKYLKNICLPKRLANLKIPKQMFYQLEEDLKKEEGLKKEITVVDGDIDYWLGNRMLSETQGLIDCCPSEVKELLSDGYHTFKELYEFRKVYNAALFNEWAKQKGFDDGINYYYELSKYDVHKSWKHHDGELCFGGDWFIVVAMLPTGQISNHYHKDDWDLFRIPEVEKAKYPFDGHTGQDVLERLKNLTI